MRRSMRPVARPGIERAAFELLDASPLCAISTAAPRTTAHIHTAYFVWNRGFEIFWLSDPAARHSRNVRVRPSTAITVFDSHQVWGQPDRGIQLFGSTRQLSATEIAHAESLYVARFPGYATPDLGAYRFYRFLGLTRFGGRGRLGGIGRVGGDFLVLGGTVVAEG